MEEEGGARLELQDSTLDVLQKMSEGNSGALRVCMDIMEKGKQIDPDSAFGCVGTLLTLDTFKIYGARIWMLYKAVCNEELVKTIAILRACQLGFLNQEKLNYAIDNCGNGINVNDLEQQVRRRLPAFGKEEENGVKK